MSSRNFELCGRSDGILKKFLLKMNISSCCIKHVTCIHFIKLVENWDLTYKLPKTLENILLEAILEC